MPFADMREWLDAMLKIGEVRMFEGVDPELEMGAMTELSAEAKGPALLFDNILGYPKGHRVMSNPFCGNRRLLATLDMPMDLTASEALMSWRLFIREFKPVPPVWVDTGPVFDHRMTGDEVDLSPFPAPRWHELDAGRYIGTGVVVVLRDPDSGWVNLGTYRLMNHDRQTVGFFIQNIRGGYRIAKKYWDQGRACPVAVSLGHDPLLLLVAGDSAARTPMGVSEYDFAGYLRGKPVEIVPGPFTGLPIPATSEVVLEGEIPSPEEEQRKEGPFGEFLGYYAHGMLEEPVIRIKSICYRNDPILFGAPPLKPTFGSRTSIPLILGELWNRLEKDGVTNITDMRQIVPYSTLVIAIRQESPDDVEKVVRELKKIPYGHRMNIIVDDDINLDDPRDVMWAVGTRCEPKTGSYIYDGESSDQMHPMMPRETQETKGTFPYSKIALNACRPYDRIKDFAPVSVFSEAMRETVRKKWGNDAFGPPRQ